jgi:hypothetical protein
MAYTKYSLTPADNNAAPPNGAPEGMLPSAVNDTMRDMMAQIRDVGDGIRGGTYTMTAAKITGGTITGVALTGNTFTSPVISGGSINNTPIGATTASTGAFSTLSVTGATTFSGATVANTFSSSGATITGGTITGITDLTVADGGTGSSTLAANAVLLGNGTSALQTVAPSTNGNVLTSTGTTWTSATPTAPVFSAGFTSTNQAVPTATNPAYTISHTLGVVPKIVRLVAVCTTAASGYSIGDETEVLINSTSNGNLQSFYWASSTVVGYYSAGAMIITDRSSGASVSLISNANFALKVYAFA